MSSIDLRELHRVYVTEARRRFVTFTETNDKVIGYLTILPVIVLFSLGVLLPVVWGVAASLHAVPAFGGWTFVGLDNYIQLIQSSEFHHSLWVSTQYAVLTTAIELVLGIGIALLINQKVKGISLVRTIVIAPYLLPTVVVALTFAFMGTNFGVINDIFLRLGIISEPVAIFTNEPWALIGLVVASVWRFTLFVVVMTLARLQSIPDGYYEAAKMSGANSWQMFKDITLPQLKSIIFIVLLLRGVWMFNKFDIIWILTRGGPGDATRVYSVMAYETAFSQFHLGEASAISVIGFILLVIVALVYFKTLRPTEEVTAQ